jgi:6-phosphofructokinase
MQAIDKIRDSSTSHERCSIIEVMGRNAGYIALWCGIASGAEDILIPERFDGNRPKLENELIESILEKKALGKKHHLIINAEGVGHSYGMAKRIEQATGVETRASILEHKITGMVIVPLHKTVLIAIAYGAINLLSMNLYRVAWYYRYAVMILVVGAAAIALRKQMMAVLKMFKKK